MVGIAKENRFPQMATTIFIHKIDPSPPPHSP